MTMGIDHIISCTSPVTIMKSASDDFFIYCEDLCKQSANFDYKKNLDATGFSYASLLDHFMLCFPELLHDHTLCFLIYDTPDFDPVYADPLTYLRSEEHTSELQSQR